VPVAPRNTPAGGMGHRHRALNDSRGGGATRQAYALSYSHHCSSDLHGLHERQLMVGLRLRFLPLLLAPLLPLRPPPGSIGRCRPLAPPRFEALRQHLSNTKGRVVRVYEYCVWAQCIWCMGHSVQ
jgi:hypothetical protein